MIVVVSTSLGSPFKAKCIESVASQVGVPFRHVYIDAKEQSPRLSHLENVRRLAMGCDPSDVIVSVDGDDWLLHDRVPLRVKEMHDAGAWVTYGSYKLADDPARNYNWLGARRDIVYMPGVDTVYPRGRYVKDYRREPWMATHLKTWRAGLYQRIRDEDLRVDGEYSFCDDVAIMCPMLEMAGPSRSFHCPDPLYVYNHGVSCEASGTSAEKELSAAHAAVMRSRPPYAELPSDLLAP